MAEFGAVKVVSRIQHTLQPSMRSRQNVDLLQAGHPIEGYIQRFQMAKRLQPIDLLQLIPSKVQYSEED